MWKGGWRRSIGKRCPVAVVDAFLTWLGEEICGGDAYAKLKLASSLQVVEGLVRSTSRT
jgi:hypothetical protein